MGLSISLAPYTFEESKGWFIKPQRATQESIKLPELKSSEDFTETRTRWVEVSFECGRLELHPWHHVVPSIPGRDSLGVAGSLAGNTPMINKKINERIMKLIFKVALK